MTLAARFAEFLFALGMRCDGMGVAVATNARTSITGVSAYKANDVSKAVHWFTAAAEMKHATAQYILGTSLATFFAGI